MLSFCSCKLQKLIVKRWYLLRFYWFTKVCLQFYWFQSLLYFIRQISHVYLCDFFRTFKKNKVSGFNPKLLFYYSLIFIITYFTVEYTPLYSSGSNPAILDIISCIALSWYWFLSSSSLLTGIVTASPMLILTSA